LILWGVAQPWLLARGNITIGELAYYVYDGTQGGPLDLAKDRQASGVLQQSANQAGLDEYRVWDWRAWHAKSPVMPPWPAAAGANQVRLSTMNVAATPHLAAVAVLEARLVGRPLAAPGRTHRTFAHTVERVPTCPE